jgi:acid phosphatase (class A)
MRPGLIVTIATALALSAGAGWAIAQQAAAPAEPAVKGYLTDQTAPNGALILPPQPTPGTDRYAADRAIFKVTRALEGTPRWALAQNDNQLTTADLEKDFSCALGVMVTPANAPKLSLLLTRAARDSSRVMNGAKAVFTRDRPFKIDPGNICIAHTDSLDNSYDYPSGHTTLSWMTGLILSELAPDRSTQILTRARAYGESRVVCGVHNASAIEAGRTTGAATAAAVNGSAEFRADLEAARAELAALRANPANAVEGGQCKAEADLTAKTPYPY